MLSFATTRKVSSSKAAGRQLNTTRQAMKAPTDPAWTASQQKHQHGMGNRAE
jgi:hypothetical protein